MANRNGRSLDSYVLKGYGPVVAVVALLLAMVALVPSKSPRAAQGGQAASVVAGPGVDDSGSSSLGAPVSGGDVAGGDDTAPVAGAETSAGATAALRRSRVRSPVRTATSSSRRLPTRHRASSGPVTTAAPRAAA